MNDSLGDVEELPPHHDSVAGAEEAAFDESTAGQVDAGSDS